MVALLAKAIRESGYTDDAGRYGKIDESLYDLLLIANFNNSHTHEEVLAVFDRAIGDKKTDISVLTDLLTHTRKRVDA